MMNRRRAATHLKAVRSGVAVVGVGMLVAACSHTSTSSTSLPPPTTVPAAPTTTAAPASTTTTDAGQVAGARCRSTVLSASIAGRSGGAGTLELVVDLTSKATVPCTLEGYPGLQMRDASGSALPTNVLRKGTYPFTSMNPTLVTLAPGGSARFNVGYSDVPVANESSCPASATMDVTAPNAYRSVSLSATIAPCNHGTVVVSPVFPPSA